MLWNLRRAKQINHAKRTELIYGWRGRTRLGRYDRQYRPYTAFNAIRKADTELLEIAGRRGDRARSIVECNVFGTAPQTSLDPWFNVARDIWDELLPFNPARYTHLLECGIQYDDIKARSHFLKVPLGLNHDRFNPDFCASEIAGFLTSVLNDDFYDFDGAALETQQMWILNCIFAKWKNLRDR